MYMYLIKNESCFMQFTTIISEDNYTLHFVECNLPASSGEMPIT